MGVHFPGCPISDGRSDRARNCSQDAERRAEVEETDQRHRRAVDRRVLCRRQAWMDHRGERNDPQTVRRRRDLETAQPIDTQAAMYGLSFMSPQEGWVVGGNGTILHTSDGGVHWMDQSSATTAALYAVQFLTQRRGTAVGAVGTVLATEDGGTTWVAQETQGSVTLFDVYFSIRRPGGSSAMRERCFRRRMEGATGSIGRCPVRGPVRG